MNNHEEHSVPNACWRCSLDLSKCDCVVSMPTPVKSAPAERNLSFQTRRAIKAEDALQVAQKEIENLNGLLNATYVSREAKEKQYDEALCTVAEQRDTMKLRLRQHLANRYAYAFKEFCEKLEEILYAAPIPQQVAEPEPTGPDMFWNHDDAEKLYFSIDEFLNDEICNGAPLEVGDTRTIQCALRLPNIEIRITAVHDEECEADYEVIAATPQPKETK